ncbi:MAG: DnaA regulatory inactivator Hda [Gammaproteobacteria bacterium]|nr:DnaA regulatory inactivator Hda [Gammaproteobacteria bacterium]
MAAQLPLGLRLPAAARFDNFVVGPNAEVVDAVRQLATESTSAVLFLSAAAGSGKTHLLQAACREAEACGGRSAYLPLAELVEHDPAMLEGLEHYALLAIDDLHALAGQRAWEEALFHLFNRHREIGGRWLSAADTAPEHLDLGLADLRSRLGWGAVYALQPVDDAARLRILTLRAHERGLELPEDTAQFLLRRCPRDLPALMALLERLDTAALSAQRRLTVPFVKAVLGVDAAG